MVCIKKSLKKKRAKEFQVRASLEAVGKYVGLWLLHWRAMLLDLCGSERERIQKLNPCGHICWGEHYSD